VSPITASCTDEVLTHAGYNIVIAKDGAPARLLKMMRTTSLYIVTTAIMQGGAHLPVLGFALPGP
jgi:hypothetical protein